jgi:tRNA pseudouridine13 synthase
VRSRPEDFAVEELPLYEPSGEGDHVHFAIEKRGLSTVQAVHRVARALGVAERGVGTAGRKDARAVTRQTLSVEHVAPEDVLALEVEGVRVLDARRHGKKLRVGHLAGNRFRIVLRESDPARAADARAMLARLEERGLPNAFGPQRFGNRGDSWLVGGALLAGDADRAVRLVAGSPGPSDEGPVLAARELFERGHFEEAVRAWPRGYETSARLCRAMARARGRPERALRALSRREVGFYVSAWQASAFNRVLAARMPDVGDVLEGEVAHEHATGRTVRVEDVEAARVRAAAFELSPTGPLPGRRTRDVRPSGPAARVEELVLAECGADELALGRGRLEVRGVRRPLRVRPTEVAVAGVPDDPAALALEFVLPPGAFATALLAELCGAELRTLTMDADG